MHTPVIKYALKKKKDTPVSPAYSALLFPTYQKEREGGKEGGGKGRGEVEGRKDTFLFFNHWEEQSFSLVFLCTNLPRPGDIHKKIILVWALFVTLLLLWTTITRAMTIF